MGHKNVADFTQAVNFILGHEGGLSVNEADPGGITNFGISQHAYPQVDVSRLTREQAVTIYHMEFWRYDAIRSQRVANKLLDQAVNFGLKGATKILQESLQYFRAPGVAADGILGADTLTAVNGVAPDDLFRELAARGAQRHALDVIVNPKLGVFLLGWLRRDIDG